MILDKNTHCFDNCPTCKGLAVWLNDNQVSPAEANRLQAQECIDFISRDEDCLRLNISVSRKEQNRCIAV